MSDHMEIATNVTFPDGEVLSVKVAISQELYIRAEIPGMINDTMARVARALNNRIQENQ